jgi:hypothetical protein
MKVTPIDIACYSFCPRLFEKGARAKLFPETSLYVHYIKKSILLAEEDALIKERLVNLKRLTSSWDKTWWPYVASSKKTSIENAKKQTLKAIEVFMEYCKYEITDNLWPTIGVDIETETKIGNSVLVSKADLIKVSLNSKQKNTTIVSINNRKLSTRDAAFDNSIQALVYSFYSGKGELMQHINISIDEKENKISTAFSLFYPEDMLRIEKALRHILSGIEKRSIFTNSFACKGCNLCPEFKY